MKNLNIIVVVIFIVFIVISNSVYAVEGKKVLGYDKLVNPFAKSPSESSNPAYIHGLINANKSVATVKVNYIDIEEAKEWLAKIFPEIDVGILKQKNIVVLKGDKNMLIKAKKVIRNLDKGFKKVNIEVKIVEVSSRDLGEIGFDWPNLIKGIPLKLKDGNITSEESLFTLLRIMEGKGQAKIIARPNISTLDNHQAIIKIGDKIPYAKPVDNSGNSVRWTIDYIEAGVKLFITPQIINSKAIKIKIETEVSSIREFIPTPFGEYPMISNRYAKSQMEAEDGKTIIIGGLINSEDRKNLSKVPFFSHIPLLGRLFKRHKKEKVQSEILFFITPRILK